MPAEWGYGSSWLGLLQAQFLTWLNVSHHVCLISGGDPVKTAQFCIPLGTFSKQMATSAFPVSGSAIGCPLPAPGCRVSPTSAWKSCRPVQLSQLGAVAQVKPQVSILCVTLKVPVYLPLTLHGGW